MISYSAATLMSGMSNSYSSDSISLDLEEEEALENVL